MSESADIKVRVRGETRDRLATLTDTVDEIAPPGVSYNYDAVIRELVIHFGSHLVELMEHRYGDTRAAS